MKACQASLLVHVSVKDTLVFNVFTLFVHYIVASSDGGDRIRELTDAYVCQYLTLKSEQHKL